MNEKELTEKEFFNQLEKIPGVAIEGEIVHGIRVLTPDEQKERKDNAELIKMEICKACAAVADGVCEPNCFMARNRADKRIAAMIPLGTKLRKLPY